MPKLKSAVASTENLAEKGPGGTLLGILSEGVICQDTAGRILSVNPAAERILGFSLSQLQGCLFRDLPLKVIHEDGSEFSAEDFPGNITLRTGQAVENVIMGICQPDKDVPVWLRTHSKLECVDEINRTGVVWTTFEDISEIRKYELLFRASEQRFDNLSETSPDAILTTDLDGHFQTANRQALEMQGFHSLEELKTSGLTIFEFAAEPSWLQNKSRLLKSLLEVSPRRVEFTFLRRDGSTFPVETNLALLVDTFQKPCGFLLISRDITDSKWGKAELRKLSQAVVHSGDSVIITDIDGSIEYVNPQFEQRTGYTLAEAVGQTPRLLKSGEHRREFYRKLWKTIKSGQIWRGELLNKRKDGTLFWEEVSIAPVFDETGQICNFVAINKEITERKQLEQALRIKDSAIESSINAIMMAELDGRLTYVNQAFLHLGGFQHAEDVIGKPLTSFLQENMSNGQGLHSLLEKGSWQGELSVRRSDGKLIDVSISAHLVRDDTGKPLCMMSSLVDITARKQAEAAERENRRMAEALWKTAEALSSTLKLNDVLDLILENAGQVIAYDSITIMLLEGQKLKVVRHRGYAERGMKTYIENADFNIADFPLLNLMLNTRQPCIIPDVLHSPKWIKYTNSAWIRSYAGVPICKREQVIGFLNLNSSTTKFFSMELASRLQAFASQVAVAIENARLYEQDHILSITDGLTGLHTSRYFFELANLEFERSLRYNSDLSIVMIDVDYFKRVNDTFGHLVGDDVLRELARRVRSCLRVVDIAARFGGEEFVLLMVKTKQSEACQVAERVRKVVAEVPIELPGGQQVWITISLGVATLKAEHLNLDMLVKSADDALYAAKSAGRNRTLVWRSDQ